MHITSRQEWEPRRGEVLELLEEFAATMERRPFQNEAGLRGVSAFALYYYLRTVQPTLVFEVGVWRGFSTWMIEQAVPDAEIWAFDPLFFFGGEPGPTYRSPRVRYFREDFSCADLRSAVKDSAVTLAFFDDHHRQLARVEQSRRVGIEHLVFDDNPPHPYSNRTLEDERRDPVGAGYLEELLERYEVFPALWDVDDAHEYPVKEAGLELPVTPELAYVYNERKWHSYVTYVRATKAPAFELNRATAARGDLGHLHPVEPAPLAAPAPAMPSVPMSSDDPAIDLVARFAASSSAAISNLNSRLATLEAIVQARVTAN